MRIVMSLPKDRLKDARQARYRSARAFALAHEEEINESTYRSHENGTRDLTEDAAKTYASLLGTTWQWLMEGDDSGIGNASPAPPTPRPGMNRPRASLLTIDELNVAATGGAGNPLSEERYQEAVVARWQMPALVIRPYTSAPEDRIKIIMVLGDSMVPDFLPGERIMVNLDDCIPSPPGVFAIWDGFGEVIKRAEMIPYSDPPMIRLISANREYEVRELPYDQVVINGRVLGKWKWT